MNVGERIKRRRKQLKMSADQLAERLGKNRSTIFRYESSEIENMPIDIVPALAKALNVSPGYIMGWEEDEEPIMSKYIYVSSPIAAGTPVDVEAVTKNNLQTINIPDEIMGKWAGSSDLAIMRINGDSMNKVIPHNSMIGVVKCEFDKLKNDDIVLFSDENDYSVKKFFNDKENKRFIFRPDSTDNRFIDYVVPYESCGNLKVYGKVVMYIVKYE